MTREIVRLDSVDHARLAGNYCTDLESHKEAQIRDLTEKTFPVLAMLLDAHRKSPDLMEVR